MGMQAQGDGDQSRLRAALLAAMRPVAAVLLRFGVGYRDFAEVLKAAFVDAATEEFGVRGRPTNISRVAAMTGLTRKEVRRIRAASAAAMEAGPATLPADVLHRWFTDPRYAAPPGQPRDLQYEGDGATFTSLVRDCAGDIPPGAVRTELRRVGALVETPAGELRATRRHVVPVAGVETLLEGLTTGLRTVAMTVGWNATVGAAGLRRFQRAVSNRAVPAARRAEAEAVLRDRLTGWTEEVDDFLASIEVTETDAATPVTRLGVGMYYYEERPPPGGGP